MKSWMLVERIPGAATLKVKEEYFTASEQRMRIRRYSPHLPAAQISSLPFSATCWSTAPTDDGGGNDIVRDVLTLGGTCGGAPGGCASIRLTEIPDSPVASPANT